MPEEILEDNLEENEQTEYDNEYDQAFFADNANTGVGEEPSPAEEEEAPAEEGEAVQTQAIEQPQQVLHTIKWNGEEIQVTDAERTALAQKGFDYTAKMQNISKFRKEAEEAGINDTVINLMKQARSGDKTAFAQLAKTYDIDPIDLLDVEIPENYANTLQKKQSGIVISEQVAPLIEQIKSNPSLQSKMERAEGLLPSAVISRMGQDATLLYNAVSEVESGAFDIVMPKVQIRLAAMSDLDREYAQNSPEVFGGIYIEEKQRLIAAAQQTQWSQGQPQTRPKPNMGEVGVKRSNTSSRASTVLKDAFNSDEEYQKILNRVKNSR